MKRVWISCVGAGTSPKRGNVYFSNVGRVACPRRLVPVFGENPCPSARFAEIYGTVKTVPYTAKRISCVGANCVRPRTGGDACPYAIPTVCLEIDLFFSQDKARRRRCMQIQRAARTAAFCKHQFPFERNCKVYLQSKFTICSASHAAEKETVFCEIDLFFRKARHRGDAV